MFKRDTRYVSGKHTVTEHYYAGGYEKIVQTQGRSRGLVEHKYHLMGGNIVITHRSNGTKDTHYLHKDTQGSVSLITNESGSVIAQYIYDPFGKQTTLSTNSLFAQAIYNAPSHQGYTGHHSLNDVGIIHMNGRIYDPTLGRFLQADPHIQAPTNTQNYNRYSYVLNNPMSYTDPSGYFFKSLRRGLIKGAVKIFGAKVVNLVGTTVSSVYGGSFGAAAWTYEFNRAMGNSTTGSLRAAFVAGVNTWANGPQSINASSALQAMDIIDPETAKYLNFAMNGVNPDDWAGTAMSAMHEVKNHYAQEEMARFAKRNGMNLGELNALLTLNSELGYSFGGDGSWSRYNSEKNLMKGFMNRGDSFMENLAGAIWDINDYMLGVQGLLDASGRDYMSSKNAGQHITDCHSLGSITCNNLVARGHAPSARLNSLPMVLVPNFSHGNNMRQTYFGSGDPINLFGLGDFFNPFSHQIDQSNSSCLLMGCHNFDPNYLHGGG